MFFFFWSNCLYTSGKYVSFEKKCEIKITNELSLFPDGLLAADQWGSRVNMTGLGHHIVKQPHKYWPQVFKSRFLIEASMSKIKK